MTGETLGAGNDFLLDTGIVIRHLRNEPRVHALLDYLNSIGQIGVSAITCMEIMVGCRTPEEERVIISLFERIPTLSVDRDVAEKAAALIKKYPTVFGRGVQRGAADALIAAMAWQHNSVLVTFNTRQFARISMAEVSLEALDQNAPDWVAQFKT